MSCFFLIDTYIDEERGRGLYDDYIAKVKPIVESCGGEYLLRSEKVSSLSLQRTPQRVIVIRFPNREKLEACFGSEQYKAIAFEQAESVDARSIIVEE